VDKRQEVQMEAAALQRYDEWLAAHMQELVDRYPSKVVAIHEDQVVFTGDSEVEVYQWVQKMALTPMPLVFRVPRAEDLSLSVF
jgi:predicted solute-binding protein